MITPYEILKIKYLFTTAIVLSLGGYYAVLLDFETES